MRGELGHASEPGRWQAGPKRWGRGAWPGWSSSSEARAASGWATRWARGVSAGPRGCGSGRGERRSGPAKEMMRRPGWAASWVLGWVGVGFGLVWVFCFLLLFSISKQIKSN